MLALNLSVLMRSKQMTIESLSDSSGIPAETIRNILYKRTANPGVLTVIPLASALGVTVEDLCGESLDENYLTLLENYDKCSDGDRVRLTRLSILMAEKNRLFKTDSETVQVSYCMPS